MTPARSGDDVIDRTEVMSHKPMKNHFKREINQLLFFGSNFLVMCDCLATPLASPSVSPRPRLVTRERREK